MHLENVIGSRAFSSSERLRSFLRFIVEKVLAGESDGLKEYAIGVAVFGRDQEYDPRIDPTVRVHARKLRDRLREYYATEGASSNVRIDLPKGAYLPVFTDRSRPCEVSVPQVNEPVAAAPISTRGTFRSASRRMLLLSIVLAFLVLPLVLLIRTRGAHPTAPNSVVVLPFVNRSANATDEYISDSLTEELTNALARGTHLHVVGRTSAFTFKQTAMDVRNIGKRLNVDTVVEGSLRRSETGFRLTVQIVDTAAGYQIWSRTFDRPADEVYALQEDLERAVVPALAPERDARTRTSPQEIRNTEAYNSYILGRFYYNKLDP